MGKPIGASTLTALSPVGLDLLCRKPQDAIPASLLLLSPSPLPPPTLCWQSYSLREPKSCPLDEPSWQTPQPGGRALQVVTSFRGRVKGMFKASAGKQSVFSQVKRGKLQHARVGFHVS